MSWFRATSLNGLNLLLCCALLSVSALADEPGGSNYWGNFRGPEHTGVSLSAKPPTEWTSEKNVAWKVEIPGKGSSSPVVWGNKVFLTSAINEEPNRKLPPRMSRRELAKKFDKDGDGRLNDQESSNAIAFRRKQMADSLTEHSFVVMCFDRSNGQEIWKDVAVKRKPQEGHHRDSGFASASPVTDGQRVYFNFGSMGLYCYDMVGKQIWKRTDLGEMRMRGTFGEGSSVALAGDLLILPWDHEGQSKIEALNKETGQTVWKTDRNEPSAWTTPVVVTVDGKQQIIHSGQTYSRGYDLSTGKELWRSSGLSQRPVSTPVAKGNVGFFGSARGGAKLNAYALNKQGDISSEPVWTITEHAPDCPSLLLSDNRLFYVSSNKAIVSCVNADSGQTVFPAKRLSGMPSGIYSSPVAADGKVYLTGRNGKTTVIADNDQFKELASNDIGENVDATLALVDDQIFIRGSKHLFCVQQKSR